ncbi:bacterial regulatory protein, luxR family protein [Asticcacaulis biprosthecium C19]|uniref:Bacterial regulatory protein, luxR family protein n=1 Tax=Asticcacaulis biprosthecium C19 TaxID=715226 RepID=F4QLS5_9CAUL|nr:helix-turn-helix transcriptional regulator [Asticcacaulis biprosthecium]EGF92344.1 bacterial regulatory protein, luxR family protein [Asticcacaulis biprosthecium C19]
MGIETLSERQKQVLRLVAQNHQAKEIARLLGISESTVKTHMEEGRRRLGIATSREAARYLAAQESASAPVAPLPPQGGYPSGSMDQPATDAAVSSEAEPLPVRPPDTLPQTFAERLRRLSHLQWLGLMLLTAILIPLIAGVLLASVTVLLQGIQNMRALPQ